MPSYYLDANALVTYYIETEGATGKQNLRRLVSDHQAYISPLTQLEFVHVLMKFTRKGLLRLSNAKSYVKELISDTQVTGQIVRRPFRMIDLPDGVFKRAERLLLDNGDLSIGSADMLHIAIIEKQRAQIIDLTMITSDGGATDGKMKKVCQKIGIPFFDPELSDYAP
ncbi:MAG: type II toxin-antitoxin system VapC family toxin [Chloroflexota bacterium]|nr:type II toxin-antitoxin system VapC family toxin [Chloroflexota bacterium]